MRRTPPVTSSEPHVSYDPDVDEDIDDWTRVEQDLSGEAGESIVNPVTADPRPRWLIYTLGHLLWIGVVYGLLALNGQLVPYVILLVALGSGMSLFALEGSRWRLVGWFVWLVAVVGVCRWLTLGGRNEPPWWIGPSLIVTIVVGAYGLWRWRRMRLKRERRRPPLVID